MSYFDSWEQSPEHRAAKKIVADASRKVSSVKADLARMKPKLGSYKKETLEKLLKEHKANLKAALKANQDMSRKMPEADYTNRLSKIADRKLKELQREYEEAAAELKRELKANLDAANEYRASGDGKGGGSMAIYARLYEQYEAMIEALEKELAVAAKEKAPNPARKV